MIIKIIDVVVSAEYSLLHDSHEQMDRWLSLRYKDGVQHAEILMIRNFFSYFTAMIFKYAYKFIWSIPQPNGNDNVER